MRFFVGKSLLILLSLCLSLGVSAKKISTSELDGDINFASEDSAWLQICGQSKLIKDQEKYLKLALQLHETAYAYVKASGYEVEDWDYVYGEKIALRMKVNEGGVDDMVKDGDTDEANKICERKMKNAKSILAIFNEKIKKSNSSVKSASNSKAYKLMVSLVLMDSNEKNPAKMIKHVPLVGSFSSEEECMTFLRWKMTTAQPEHLKGGGWVPHPSGKELVCKRM